MLSLWFLDAKHLGSLTARLTSMADKPNNKGGFLSIAPLIIIERLIFLTTYLFLYFADFFLNENARINERAAIKRTPPNTSNIFSPVNGSSLIPNTFILTGS